MVDVDPPFLSNTEGEAEKSRRFWHRHRSGHVASQGAEVVVDPVDVAPPESDLFGLEDSLERYIELWDIHQTFIDETLADEETESILRQALLDHEYTVPLGTERRRHLHQLAKGGYPRFVGVFVAAGRVAADYTHLGKFGHVDTLAGIKSIRQETAADKETVARLISKKGGLFAAKNLQTSHDRAKKLDKRFDDIQTESHRTIAPIYKLEREMGFSIYNRLAEDPHASLVLLDTFINCSESEAPVDRAFAAFLANRLKTFVNRSELSIALHNAEQLMEGGGMVPEYVAQSLAQNGGDNTMAFFERAFAASPEEFVARMTAHFPDWPPDYKAAYQAFVHDRISTYRVHVDQKFADKAKNTAWMRTDMVELERELDRLFRTIYQNYGDAGLREPNKVSEKGAGRSHSGPTEIVLASRRKKFERPSAPREVLTVVRTFDGGFLTRNGMDVDGVIADLIGNTHKDNKVFIAEFRAAIEKLRIEPFAPHGVHSASNGPVSQKIALDGKTMRVYEANLAKMEGLATSRQSKELRIVFTADGRRLNILGLFTQHGDYTRFLRQL